MNKLSITALSAACLLALGGGANAAMTKAEQAATATGISAAYTAEKAACNSMKNNAKDVCIQEAKGREAIAKAQLDVDFAPADKTRHDLLVARADAAYSVAKEKCDDFSGNRKDVCRKDATSAHVAAKADAKLALKTTEANAVAKEKTQDANAVASEKNRDARSDAASIKRDAEFAFAKEKCDAFAGDAKSTCVDEAKLRYGQS